MATDFATATAKLSSGHAMPMVGLGTFQAASTGCEEAVATALKTGYRLIDTASVYRNEAAVAAGIKASGIDRSQVFVTSKLQPTEAGDGAYEACLKSLERLGMDYVDLFLIHWPGKAKLAIDDPAQSEHRKRSWQALQRLYEEGKCRSIGVSNFMPKHLNELCSAEWCTVKPAVNQFELHPLLKNEDAVACCDRWGVQVQAYSSLARGATQLLDSKAVTAAAAAHGATPAQIVLRWALQKGYCVIPKSIKPERIVENWVGATTTEWSLSGEEMTALDSLEKKVGTLRTCWDPTTIA